MTPERWTRDFLESSRGQVAALMRRNTATVDDLAAQMDLTPNAIRGHLQTLIRDGVVRPAGRRRGAGAGKPATLYELTPAAEPIFSRAYEPLLSALMSVLATGVPPATRDAVLEAVARKLTEGEVSGPIAKNPVARAQAFLEGLGGEVTVTSSGGEVTIGGHGCPLSLFSAEHATACELVGRCLTAVAGCAVRVACVRDPGPACRFALTPPRRATGSV